MKQINNKTYDEERALYGVSHVQLINCAFAGDSDGESALKETEDLAIENCKFLLRYPLWHVTKASVSDSIMTDTCRAALWYDCDVTITNSTLGGIKAVRECDNTIIENSKINSTEFGWFCRALKIRNTDLISEYPFLKCRNMELDNLHMTAKYSFQYVENAVIKNSVLQTKDAFWHSRNITVYDSEINGEYLGWYSHGLRLVRCKITGTQPLCYAKNLVLEDCEMTDCDLSFEKSDVTATVRGHIDSVKNPASGSITADSIGEIITNNENTKITEKR